MLYDIDMERAFLGAVLAGEGANDHLLPTLREGDFTDGPCRRVFAEMLAAQRRGTRLDVRTVASYAAAAGAARDSFVSTLLEAVATPANGHEYARRVSELAGLRGLAAIDGRRIAGDAETLQDALAEMRLQVAQVESGRTRDRMVTVDDVAKAYFAGLMSDTAAEGLATGITLLDHALGGLLPAAVYLVAARPGVGKSTLMMSIAEHVALKLGRRVAFFSLEMTCAQLMGRLTSSVGRVDHELLRRKLLGENDWARVSKAVSALAGSPLMLMDKAPMTLTEIHAIAKAEHARSPLSLVCVDYLQLVRGERGRNSNREQEVADVARGLKLMSMDLQIPVIVAAQLNRDVEKRADKRPMLADLRESGELEQSSDVVLMIHREWVTDREANPEAAELLIRKNRHGDLGELPLRFLGRFCRFEAAVE